MKSDKAKLTQGKPSAAIISMMAPMVIGLIVMIGILMLLKMDKL